MFGLPPSAPATPQPTIEPTFHPIIEAPWLVNGEHGASLRHHHVVTDRELAEDERPGGPPEAVRALDLRSFSRMEPCPGVSSLKIARQEPAPHR
jgi:hypothetical protein